MALNYPEYENLSDSARAQLRRGIPQIDPTVFGSFSRAFVDGSAVTGYTGTQLVRDLERQFFPQTAEGEFLEMWGGYDGLTRLQASAAQGQIVVGGTAATIIPQDTLFSATSGLQYRSLEAVEIQPQSQVVSTLTRTGTTATATTSAPHNLATGMEVAIAGANEADYNGTFSIVATSTTQFTYTVSGSPATPATGTITVSGAYALVTIQCTTTGQATNLTNGAPLSLLQPISGASGPILVNVDNLTGGADIEDDEGLRVRVLLSRSQLEGVFTNDQIRLAALSVPGNTRVHIVNPTLSACDPGAGSPGMIPAPGQVVIYFLRDNDENIIPSGSVIQTTKDAIIANGSLPGQTSPIDVFVFAPIPVPVNFSFSEIVPDTPTMRQAVNNQLTAFFEDRVTFDEDVLESQYLGALDQTRDLTTGETLTRFTLTTPTGDVTISAGQIATLGTVTFA